MSERADFTGVSGYTWYIIKCLQLRRYKCRLILLSFYLRIGSVINKTWDRLELRHFSTPIKGFRAIGNPFFLPQIVNNSSFLNLLGSGRTANDLPRSVQKCIRCWHQVSALFWDSRPLQLGVVASPRFHVGSVRPGSAARSGKPFQKPFRWTPLPSTW